MQDLKSLIQSLRDQGIESAYLERLGLRVAEASHRSLEQEIRSEMAAALGRAGEKLDRAMLEVDLAARALDAFDADTPREERLLAYEEARQRALKARWEMMVHREALGLFRHDEVDAYWPVPPPRR